MKRPLRRVVQLAWASTAIRGALFVLGLAPREGIPGDDVYVILVKELVRFPLWAWGVFLMWKGMKTIQSPSKGGKAVSDLGASFLGLAAVNFILATGAALEWIAFSGFGYDYSSLPLWASALDIALSLAMFGSIYVLIRTHKQLFAS